MNRNVKPKPRRTPSSRLRPYHTAAMEAAPNKRDQWKSSYCRTRCHCVMSPYQVISFSLALRLSCLLSLYFRWFLIKGAENLRPIIVGILRQRPRTRRRLPGFCQHDGVLNGDLVGEVVLRGASDALDHMHLVTRPPPSSRTRNHPHPFINANHVDDQGISLPMSGRVAIESGIRIFVMRTSITVYQTNVHGVFKHLPQLPSRE